ncbi:hypothetical protein [Microcoleus sp. EPA2]
MSSRGYFINLYYPIGALRAIDQNQALPTWVNPAQLVGCVS